MPSFDGSTLWRISAFERLRQEGSPAAFSGQGGPKTVLPTTLLADLRHHRLDHAGADVLQVVASCLQHRSAALLYLQHGGLVWPVTLFPAERLYHAPRALLDDGRQGLSDLSLLSIEPPGVRPPGHWMHERVAAAEHYRPLAPLLWTLALHGPRFELLDEIAGTAAYRALRMPQAEGLVLPGALAPAVQRLRRESVPLRDMAGWPGLSLERASRLLNALYLGADLLVSRAHPAARDSASLWQRIRGLPRRGH